MSEFKREVRYVVIKLKDIDENQKRQLGNFMQDLSIPSRECVVVESDWPEYEVVWQMLEARMAGKTDRITDLDRRNVELEKALEHIYELGRNGAGLQCSMYAQEALTRTKEQSNEK